MEFCKNIRTFLQQTSEFDEKLIWNCIAAISDIELCCSFSNSKNIIDSDKQVSVCLVYMFMPIFSSYMNSVIRLTVLFVYL